MQGKSTTSFFVFFSNTNQLMVALCEGSDSEEEGEELAGAGRVPGLGFPVAWELVSGRKHVCRVHSDFQELAVHTFIPSQPV